MKRGNDPRLSEKRYLVATPMPFLDSNGKKLKRWKVKKWVRMAEKELTECFGGATPIPAPGTNIVGGKILYEKGQILVLSGCDSRNDFLAKRDRIQAFAERMGRELSQKQAFVLACPSASFLIEIEAGFPE